MIGYWIKVKIFLGFSFAVQRRQTHGKNHEGKQQTTQTINRKGSGIPHHENRKYLHYFGKFGKQKLIPRIYTVPSIISAIYDFKIMTPRKQLHLCRATRKWQNGCSNRTAMVKNWKSNWLGHHEKIQIVLAKKFLSFHNTSMQEAVSNISTILYDIHDNCKNYHII